VKSGKTYFLASDSLDQPHDPSESLPGPLGHPLDTFAMVDAFDDAASNATTNAAGNATGNATGDGKTRS